MRATASIKKGKVTRGLDIHFNTEVVKALADGKSYRHLGVAQVFQYKGNDIKREVGTFNIRLAPSTVCASLGSTRLGGGASDASMRIKADARHSLWRRQV